MTNMGDEIDSIYKETFGHDFSKMGDDEKARADRLVAAASAPKYIIQNGQWTANPARQQFDEMAASGELSSKLVQQLGVYASWRSGAVPGVGPIGESTMMAARRAGIPDAALARESGDRQAQVKQWAQGAKSRFLGDLKLPPEDIDPKTGLSYERVYPGPNGELPPKIVPPEPEHGLKSQPDLQLPPEDIDPKTGLSYSKVYTGPNGELPPAVVQPQYEFGSGQEDLKLAPENVDPVTGLDFTKKYGETTPNKKPEPKG